MPSRGSITKTIRIGSEDRERLERLVEKEGYSWSSAVHELMALKNENQKICGLNEKQYKNLEQMCAVSGISVGRFMEYVVELFEDGHIYIDGLTVKTRGDEDLRELKEVCHRLNVEPQMMIEKLTKSLMRG